MTITQKINLDFARQNIAQRVFAVQGDSGTRVVEASLYENCIPWTVPSNASVRMRYRLPDGTGDVYDTLPDGEPFWSADENVLRVILAPQMMTIPGLVEAQLQITTDSDMVATFRFGVMVEADPSNGVPEPQECINWANWTQTQLEKLIDQAMKDGAIIAPAGADGKTPYIGANGSWWIGDSDTGVQAQGPQGATGPQGEQGPAGADGETPNIWLAPYADSPGALWDGLQGQYLMGAVEATAETVHVGDLVICGVDGGVLLVSRVAQIGGVTLVGVTSGASGRDPADGAAVYIKGEAGEQGPQGADGQTPNITIGTVETLPAGSAATASIGGITPNLTLNLGIPQGNPGEGGGTGGGSADWSVNDENAEGYVANRTHWRVNRYNTGSRTAVDSSSVEFALSDLTSPDGTALYYATIESVQFPREGTLVSTTFDGVQLDNTATVLELGLAFGNLYLLDATQENTEGLWCAVANPEDYTYTVYTTDTAASHSVKVEWRYQYYGWTFANSSFSYSLGGEFVHSFDLGEGELTAGSTYELSFMRDPQDTENATLVTVMARATVAYNGNEVSGEFTGIAEYLNHVLSEWEGIGSIYTENGHIYMEVHFDLAGCPDANGSVALFDVHTEDDPAQLYEWHKLDEHYLPYGRPDWNQNDPNGDGYIKNRPFYEVEGSVTNQITWDGSMEGMELVEVQEGTGFVKISDSALSVDQLVGAEITLSGLVDDVDGDGYPDTVTVGTFVLSIDDIYDGSSGGIPASQVNLADLGFLFVREDCTIAELSFTAGVWVMVTFFEVVGASRWPSSIVLTGDYIGEAGAIHKMDPKFIDADWIATKTVVKNATLFPETTFTFKSGQMCDADFSFLTIGSVYTVVWNGVTYTRVCQNHPLAVYLGVEIPYIGNTVINGGWGSDTGEPFVVGPTGIYSAEDGEATFTIMGDAVEYNKLPEEYLPDSLDEKYSIDITPVKVTELGADGTGWNELYTALNSGREAYYNGYRALRVHYDDVDGIYFGVFADMYGISFYASKTLTNTESYVGKWVRLTPTPEEAVEGGGVQTDWNQTDETAADFLKNKPTELVASDTLTWDGNMTGREFVDLEYGRYLVHVSDATPSLQDLANGCIITVTAEEEMIEVPLPGDSFMVGENWLLHANMTFAVTLKDNVDIDGFIFPKAGIYLYSVPDIQYHVSSLTIRGVSLSIKETLNDEILPGATILYADGTYLYESTDISDTNKRISKTKMEQLMRLGRPVYVAAVNDNGAIVCYAPIAGVILVDDYASVYINGGLSTTSGISLSKYYTYEYTAS